ncbi:MAG: hypothetical protein ACI9BW_000632 [Gammaproteobacteria bacterium]|jgi:hypothetical protein
MRNFMQVFFTVFCGIVQPSAALIYELLTQQCASIFFDPIPTVAHMALVAVVPLSNLAIWWNLKRNNATNYVVLLRWNAVAIGIALFYAILFLPLVPIGIVGVIVLIGLLPLAPLCSLIVSLRLRRALKIARPAIGQTGSKAWPAILAGFAILVMLETPAIVTQVGLQIAGSTHSSEQVHWIKFLRRFGSEPLMRSVCYGRSGRAKDIFSVALGFYRPISTESAREIYYQVTGNTFNSQPRPTGLHFSGFDRDQGSNSVGQRIENLYLRDSRLQVAIDPDALLAYLEWTMVVQNDSERLAEARFQVQLPPGAVVSRVSLWIDGEPRESAFGSRGQVREAYENVVRARRDPILVSHTGADSVLVQLFPVPARGGEMQFRIGVTAPLDLADLKTAWLQLPEIQARNFAIPESTRHTVHAESRLQLASPTQDLIATKLENNLSIVTGDLSQSLIDSTPMSVRVARKPDRSSVWTNDNRSEQPSHITQVIEESTQLIDRVILVIDGSRSMAEHRQWLVDLVRRTPPSIALSIVIASDEVVTINGDATSRSNDFALFLADDAFVGGVDNSAALRLGLEMAEQHSNSAVLWLHGRQDVLFDASASRAVRPSLANQRVPLVAVQLASGRNRLKEAFASDLNFRVLPSYGNDTQALERLFQQWSGAAPRYQLQRNNIAGPRPLVESQVSTETSFHLARLWAYESVIELLNDGAENSYERAHQRPAQSYWKPKRSTSKQACTQSMAPPYQRFLNPKHGY